MLKLSHPQECAHVYRRDRFSPIVIASFIFSAILFAPANSHAQTSVQPQSEGEEDVQSKDPAKQVQNLIFYPHRGEFRLNPELLDQISYRNTVYDSSGNELSMDTQSYFDISLEFAYGLTNRWRVLLAENYLFSKTTARSVIATGNQTYTTSEGLSDPTLSTSYRFLQNYRHGLFADIVLSVTPEVAPRDLPASRNYALNGQTGNNVNGGWTAGANLPIYYRSGRNEIGLEAMATHSFGAFGYAQAYANSLTFSPYTQVKAWAEDRFHFTRNFFLGLSTQYNFPFSSTATQLWSGAVTQDHADGNLFESLVIGFLEDIHTLVMLTVSFNSANGNTQSTTNKTDQTTANIDVFMYY